MKKRGGPCHKGVAESSEVGTIAHFFGEKIGGVGGTFDVGDLERSVLNPFADRGLTVFHVANFLGCHVVAPAYASLVIVEEVRGGRQVRDWETVADEAFHESAAFDGEFGGFVCGADFRFTRAE